MTEIDKPKDLIAEKLFKTIARIQEKADSILEVALERAILIEEMDKKLEEIADEMETKETELLGTLKEMDNPKEEEQILDQDPHSPTFQQMINA